MSTATSIPTAISTSTLKLKKHKAQFYDFYRDGVTQSFIDMWLRCPHQAKLCYVDGLKPLGSESQAIVFGNACHFVLEHAYSQVSTPNPGMIKAYLKKFEETLDLDNRNDLSSDEYYQYEVTLAKAEATMKSYFQHYASDFEHNWEIAETIFKIPFKFPDGKTTYISGKLDGGFMTKDDNLWLMDHKCMSRVNIENLLVLLPVDIQVNIYLWCVRELTEKTPKGFKYNIIRNTSMAPLKSKEESLTDYANRVQSDIDKRPMHYFTRIKIPVMEAEIVRYKREWLDPIMRDIRKWYDSKYRWPEYYRPNNLKTEYGTMVPWAYILAENDFSKFEKRQHLFPELVY